ncbi:MAG: hypothetical protein EAZ57_01415 [Cytophagales bacterium]|nr:MAG: hypothetical protein EAZ67_01860 [Cytophagales bacterium]TAF62109.1 MAG: hypothetical protein EAZ57_01415 [Cytophagales bacterium]
MCQNKPYFLIKSLFGLLFCFLWLSGCQFYHDTTSRFNAYFLAQEKLLLVEENLFGNPKNDFNRVIDVFPALDSSFSGSEQANIQYCIDKATIPIQYHKSSHYVDDCWLVIGKALLYGGSMEKALQTFKYINSISDNPNLKHSALIYMMRAYTETQNYENVEFVLSVIQTQNEVFNTENARAFYLNAAHYYRKIENWPTATAYLEKVVSDITPKRKQARYYYLLAQMYEEMNLPNQANSYYKLCLNSLPDYDLEFNASLNASKTFNASNSKPEETERYFKKLLFDQKNVDFHDRIYYEMANFEVKRKAYDLALQYLNTSVMKNKNNPTQKAYSYLRAGEVNFEYKENFTAAADYYDSALTLMNSTFKNYSKIKRRNEVLEEFITAYRNVKKQDRLLALSKKTPAELKLAFEQEIQAEKDSIDRQIELAKKREKAMAAMAAASLDSKDNKNEWYFYNTVALNFGKAYFQREWNNRPLADNWRRSNRVANRGADEGNEAIDEKEEEKDPYASIKSLESRLKEVPKTDAEGLAARQILEENLFALGKIYHQKLEDDDKALVIFKRYVDEFRKSDNTPEVYYLLHTICAKRNDCNPNNWAERIKKEYPNSLFAKSLENPTLIAAITTEDPKANANYKAAYELYRQEKYAESAQMVQNALEEQPNSSVTDKLQLLRIMLIPKNGGSKETFKNELDKFIATYTQSNLQDFAKSMLAAVQ